MIGFRSGKGEEDRALDGWVRKRTASEAPGIEQDRMALAATSLSGEE